MRSRERCLVASLECAGNGSDKRGAFRTLVRSGLRERVRRDLTGFRVWGSS